MNDNVQNGEVIIDINALSKAFGDLKVLTNISTQIRKGDVVCVIGPSGSGKSTFTNRIKKHFGDDVVLLDLNGAFFDGSVHLSLS
mgnify:CR=1 FL=1